MNKLEIFTKIPSLKCKYNYGMLMHIFLTLKVIEVYRDRILACPYATIQNYRHRITK